MLFYCLEFFFTIILHKAVLQENDYYYLYVKIYNLKTLLLICSFLIGTNLSAQTFIKNLGIAKYNDGATSIAKSENGYIIAGYSKSSTFLSEVDMNGRLLWKDVYHITDQLDLITDMKVHNGKIIACGYGYYEGSGIFLEFYFKYDIASKSFDWIKKSKLKLKPSTIQILPNGNYLMTGDEIYVEDFKVFLMEIDSKKGKLVQYSSWKFTGNESASTALIHGKNIFIGGRYALEQKLDKYRGAISKFDFKFNEIWSNYYLNKKDKYVRNYLNKLIIDKNEIVSIFATNNHGISNLYNITLAKQTLDGEAVWAKEISLDGYSNINIRDIKASKDGYYLYGFTNAPSEQLFLIKTDKEGTVQWSKTFGGSFSENILTDQGNFMELTDEHIYLIGQSNGLKKTSGREEIDYDALLIKLNLDGSFDMDCWGEDIKTRTHTFEDLVQGGIYLFGRDSFINNNNLSYKKEENLEDKPYP